MVGLAIVVSFGLLLDAIRPHLLRRPWPTSVEDYAILYKASRKIVHDQAYPVLPGVFPYPPSAVIIFYLTGLPSYPEAAAFWLVVSVAATVGTLLLGMSLVGLSTHPWRWPAALAALLVSHYHVMWDLRSVNCNMIYCFLLTAGLYAVYRQRPNLAGPLLAASVALKLFPVLLIPYLWWIGQRRACLSSIVWLGVFFIVLPVVYFGGLGLYPEWLQHLNEVAAITMTRPHPILVSLPYTLPRLLGDPELARTLVLLAGILWFGAVAFCLWAEPARKEARATGWNLAVDGGLLVLAPVVIGPYLEPYHPVSTILIALALAQLAFDTNRSKQARAAAAVALAAAFVALQIAGRLGFHYRGIGILALSLILTCTLAALRRAQARQASTVLQPARAAA